MEDKGFERLARLHRHLVPENDDPSLSMNPTAAATPLADGYCVKLPETLVPHNAPWVVRR